MREGMGSIRIVARGQTTENYIGSTVPSTYTGEFRNDRINGHGVWVVDNGQRFEGEFVNNILMQESISARSPQQSLKPKIVAQGFDKDANANIFLYDDSCTLSNLSSDFNYRWNAVNTSSGQVVAEGCFNVNQHTKSVNLISSSGGKVITKSFADFGQGGNSGNGTFGSIAQAIQGMANYVNNSAAQTQNNTVDLNRNRSSHCVPDGRGGFNCN